MEGDPQGVKRKREEEEAASAETAQPAAAEAHQLTPVAPATADATAAIGEKAAEAEAPGAIEPCNPPASPGTADHQADLLSLILTFKGEHSVCLLGYTDVNTRRTS